MTRRFGDRAAVDDLSVEVQQGELLALVGASGSGKTTTLRMIAGYELPDAGSIVLDGRDITNLPPRSRRFGMVFQHYALFPHMTVGENVAFGLEARGINRVERRERAKRVLVSVGLDGAAGRAVQTLSGGEQQRVALARALVIEPRVLLLDEPLSNLDPTLRRSTREDLRATLRRLEVTAVFVTHDQEDAFAVADRIAVLRDGRLLQVGVPEDVYDRPTSRAVAEFLGRATMIPARWDGPGGGVEVTIGGITRRFEGVAPIPLERGTMVFAVIRPDALAFASAETDKTWSGVVTTRRFAGALLAYHVELAGGVGVEVFTAERGMREGDRVVVRVAREPVAVVVR